MDRVTIHHQKNPPQLIRAKEDFSFIINIMVGDIGFEPMTPCL